MQSRPRSQNPGLPRSIVRAGVSPPASYGVGAKKVEGEEILGERQGQHRQPGPKKKTTTVAAILIIIEEAARLTRGEE